MYQHHLTSTGPSSVVPFTRRPAAAIISTDYRLMHHLMCSCVVGLVAGGGRGGGRRGRDWPDPRWRVDNRNRAPSKSCRRRHKNCRDGGRLATKPINGNHL